MEENNNNIWRTIGLILIGAFIGYLIGRFSYLGAFPDADRESSATDSLKQSAEPVKLIQNVSIDDDPSLGSNTAKVVIVEFSDYQCPFCKNFYTNILPELKKDYINTGKVKYVYRDFPLNLHKSAIDAAMAANCAGDQGKYWEMHDKLFENQDMWSDADNPKDLFKTYAFELRLNTYTFNECLDSEKYKDEIIKDKEEGVSYGVSGTPTLFLNGKILRGGYSQDFDAFQLFLEKEFGI